MLGTIVNTGTILVGSVFGAIVREGIGEKYKKAMFDALLERRKGKNTCVGGECFTAQYE